MIVNESSNTKKIEDATAISKEIGYNEIAYINNNEKITGEMPIEYNNTQIIYLNQYENRTSDCFAYGNNKCVGICSAGGFFGESLNLLNGQWAEYETESYGGMFGDIVFGNEIFVSLAGESRETAVSEDGINWTMGDVLGNRSESSVGAAIVYDKNKKLFGAATPWYWNDNCTYYISNNGLDWEEIFTLYETNWPVGKLMDKKGNAYYVSQKGRIENIYGELINQIPIPLDSEVAIAHGTNGAGIIQLNYPSRQIYVSNDNYQTWQLINLNSQSLSYNNSFAYFQGMYIIKFWESSDIMISKNLIDWFILNIPYNLEYFCVCDNKILGFSPDGKTYISYDLINWKNEIITENYKLKNTDSGMLITIPEQTVERRIIKEEYNNTPYIRFEDETLIFASLEDVIEGNQSNHPEGSYYMVYDDTILLNANNINNYFEITYEDWDTNEFYWNENNEFVNDWSTSITRAIVENTSSPTLKALINLNLSFIAQIQNPEYSNSLSISNSVNSNTIRLGYNTELTNAINIDLNKGDTITLEHVDSASIAKLIDMKINLL